MINVTRSSMPGFEEYCEEIKDMWDSHWLTNMGTKHRELEEKLRVYLDCKNICLHANGHLALENVIAAMDLPAGSEVITTPFTFASTTHAIVRNGLVPVFCDINPDDYTIDVSQIEKLITKKTAAIIPVHVYGNMCDVFAIERIAARHGLKVIYDAAHAFGVKLKGVSAANFGDASMFSFHATKVFNTIEGGAVCFCDDSLNERLNDLKNFGIHDQETVVYAGGNAKMNEFQAAMGICNLRHVDEEIAKRKKVSEHYDSLLSGIPGIKLQKPQADVTRNYSYYPVLFDGFKKSRNEVYNELKSQEIMARKYFYPLTSSFSCYKGTAFSKSDTPCAEYTADRILTLPLYADLSLNDVERICEIINR